MEKREVAIALGRRVLEGTLVLPDDPRGLVLFAHGSGSSRFSPRNRFVAAALQRAGLGTLLFDLLTAEEEAYDAYTAELRFDVELLAERLIGARDWVRVDPDAGRLPLGYFGSSTGAAAALIAAARHDGAVRAVVSRGGRPDLAGADLPQVRAPTLLIVGGNDDLVIELNRRALAQLRTEARLVIVPGATHLFEEAGALDEVARLAAEWFRDHLSEPVQPSPSAA